MVNGDTQAPYFARVEEICLDEITSFIDVPRNEARMEPINTILSQQHSIGFNMTGSPLWRVLVLKDQESHPVDCTVNVDIILGWNRVIGDGRSGMAVHTTILNALNAAQSDEDPLSKEDSAAMPDSCHSAQGKWFVRAPAKPLFPSLETKRPTPSSPRSKLSKAIKPWLPIGSNEMMSSPRWSGGSYNAARPIKTQIRHIKIPSTAVAGLLTLCRSKQTTMTPYMQCLIGIILFKTLHKAASLRCAVAVSLRRFFPPSTGIDERQMGLWVSAFHSEYAREALYSSSSNTPSPDATSSSFWTTAQKESARIKDEIATGKEDIRMDLLREVSDYRYFLLAKIGKDRDDSYAVTNLGVTGAARPVHGIGSMPEIEDWRIAELVFSQSCHVNGSAIQFCIVTLNGGDMCIALSWQEGVVSVELVESIARRLKEGLLSASGMAMAS